MGNLSRWVLRVLIGCFAIGPHLALAAPSGAETASIVIAETNYNFGELSEMAPFSHDFIVKNSGKATLHIRNVEPS